MLLISDINEVLIATDPSVRFDNVTFAPMPSGPDRHVPFTSLKHPPESSMPLAKVEVFDVMFNPVPCIPPRVDVAPSPSIVEVLVLPTYIAS